MNILKKVIFVISIVALFVISIGILVIGKGYDIYKEALEQVPLAERIESIKQKESYTKIEELPQIYINAIISVEDRRFYTHKGIDIIAIGRALVNDIKTMSFAEGGSTITQQLAKNMYFTQEKKITRKIAEIFMAFEIESHYEKKEILELYINTMYFGDGYYTVKEACKGYFNKDIKEMTDYEWTMLAGIPNAPSVYAPTKNPNLAQKRQKQVLNRMVNNGFLTEGEAENIINKNE